MGCVSVIRLCMLISAHEYISQAPPKTKLCCAEHCITSTDCITRHNVIKFLQMDAMHRVSAAPDHILRVLGAKLLPVMAEEVKPQVKHKTSTFTLKEQHTSGS